MRLNTSWTYPFRFFNIHCNGGLSCVANSRPLGSTTLDIVPCYVSNWSCTATVCVPSVIVHFFYLTIKLQMSGAEPRGAYFDDSKYAEPKGAYFDYSKYAESAPTKLPPISPPPLLHGDCDCGCCDCPAVDCGGCDCPAVDCGGCSGCTIS